MPYRAGVPLRPALRPALREMLRRPPGGGGRRAVRVHRQSVGHKHNIYVAWLRWVVASLLGCSRTDQRSPLPSQRRYAGRHCIPERHGKVVTFPTQFRTKSGHCAAATMTRAHCFSQRNTESFDLVTTVTAHLRENRHDQGVPRRQAPSQAARRKTTRVFLLDTSLTWAPVSLPRRPFFLSVRVRRRSARQNPHSPWRRCAVRH